LSEARRKEVWIELTREASIEDIYRAVEELLEKLEDYTCTTLTGKARKDFLIKVVGLDPGEVEAWPFEYKICTKPGKRVIIVRE